MWCVLTRQQADTDSTWNHTKMREYSEIVDVRIEKFTQGLRRDSLTPVVSRTNVISSRSIFPGKQSAGEGGTPPKTEFACRGHCPPITKDTSFVSGNLTTGLHVEFLLFRFGLCIRADIRQSCELSVNHISYSNQMRSWFGHAWTWFLKVCLQQFMVLPDTSCTRVSRTMVSRGLFRVLCGPAPRL